MTFTDLFIRRPVLSIVVSLLILLLGAQALSSLSIRQFPFVENSQIRIQTIYTGASPEVVKSFITTKIQQAVAGTEGVDTISSSSSQGISEVTLQLRLGADADRAVTDAMSKVNQVRSELPREAFDPTVTRESSEGNGIMYIDFSSKVLNPAQITDYLTRVVQPALQTVDGVAKANILGAQTFSMRVWLKPDRMAALGVTATDVRQALEANNFTAAPGEMKGQYVKATIDAKTDLASVEEFAQLVVASRDGALVRLRDVAELDLGPESNDFSAFATGERAVFIEIQNTPSSNALSVIPKVREVVAQLKQQAPKGLNIEINYDATEYIRSAILEVVKTVAEAALIVIVIVYLFLGNIRSTLIPIVTIPLSLIGVLFLLQVLGYSINLLTLLALVLAIGLVVDDAIVVVENISRHIEEGMTPYKAALQGAREIALPVIGMTVTLAAVYAPIGFVSGLTGILFQEFAFTLAAAVIISGIVALTLSPMMCAKILRPHAGEASQGSFAHWLDERFERLHNGYARVLEQALRARRTLLVLGAVVLGGCVMFYDATRKELAPDEDQGFLFMLWKAPESVTLDYLDTYAEQFHPIFKTFPEYQATFMINGVGGAQGFGGFLTKPWEERDRGPKEIVPELQEKLRELPGVQASVFNVPSLPTPGGGGMPVQFVIQTLENYDTLSKVVDELQAEADKSGLFIFSDIDLRFDKPQVDIRIDRAKANQLGVSMADIGNTLSTLLGGNYVNLFDLEGRSYRVIPQVPRSYRVNAELLGSYYVRAASGDLIPLSTFVTVSRSIQPNGLKTFQQLNSATLSGVPFPGRTQGEVLEFLEAKAKTMLPEGFTYDYAGESRQFKQEGATLATAFIFALIIIFLVLAAQYESFRDPIIVLVSVPMSVCGALLVLNIGSIWPTQPSGFSINIYTQIGLLTLAGLISKHGILMVSFANELQATRGLEKRAAIVEAAAIRLRPILMTTAAMVAGVMPLLLAGGAGAVSRFSMGLVIASGMTIGTLFTLFIVPVVYSYLAADHRPRTATVGAGRPAADPAE